MCANSAEIAGVDRVEAAEERADQRLHLARELLEHEVLVLHLGDEARRLEQPLAVVPAGAVRSRAADATAGGLPQASAVALIRRSMSFTSRLCSEWNIW